MTISIHSTFAPHTDADAALAFYTNVLGFELRNDVGYEGMRWITVGPVGSPVNIVLHPPVEGAKADEGYPVVELVSTDLDGDFAKIKATGVEILQPPTEQPYGATNCEFRDPSGNHLRMQQG